MRVLVTGGAGYIGSVVSEMLVAASHDVVVYDNLSTGQRQAVPRGCALIEGDVRDTDALRDALDQEIDAVLHFAARSLVPESMQDPVTYWEHNVGASLSLVRAMQDIGVSRLIFSSTAAVYGEPRIDLLHEELPCQPMHAYGASKRAIEMLLEDAQRAGCIDSIFLRYFNAAGASASRGENHRPETHLIPNLLAAAAAGRPARIYGDDYATADGTCVRDYVHVVDLGAAHVAALTALDAGVRGAINLGSGHGWSVREVVDCVRQVTGIDLQVQVEGRRPGDPSRLVASIARAADHLHGQPQQDLEGMVRSSWDWLQSHGQRARTE
jgi:UDP-glucose 4-epimerase